MSNAVFESVLAQHDLGRLHRDAVSILQVNVGKRCNQACHHCHVEAGPKRTEQMVPRTSDRVLEVLAANPGIQLIDITGGAPELNPQFRPLVEGARSLGRRVLDRCNLTVLYEPGQEDTAAFLAENEVGIVASLPCYTADNVDAQRGRGVFGKSIEALQLLNRMGYGLPGSALRLDLVYNPLGATLPPEQSQLQERYRKELDALFDISFHHLLTITNMPIKRFADELARTHRTAEYQSLLVHHFNPASVPNLMCNHTLSVGYDGSLYDCDFNQMLEIPLGNRPRTIFDVRDLAELVGEPIATAPHCFGCTAGAGSSCGGALAG